MERYKCKACGESWFTSNDNSKDTCQICNSELIQMDSLDVKDNKIREKEETKC